MATINRIEPTYAPWGASKSGSAVTDAGRDYLGRHRAPENRAPENRRMLSMLRMFYRPRHRRR